MKLAGLWRHDDFMRLWAGQTISVFGSMVGGTAMSFTAILFLQATPFQMGMLNAMHMIPAFLIGLFAGAWVDRLNRRPLLIWADIGRALALATIPLAAVMGALGIFQLYAVALIVSLLTIVFDLSYQAYLPVLVGKDHILEGNSKLTASSSVAEFVGFSAGGWLVQLLTGPVAILVDAFSFVVSAVSVGLIRAREDEIVRETKPNMLKEIAGGLSEVMRQPFLRACAVTTGIDRFCGGIFGALVVLYMSRGLGFEPGILAMTWAVGGISSFAGAALAPMLSRKLGTRASMILGIAISGLFSFSIPLASGATLLSLVLLVLAQFSDGFTVIYEINLVSMRQKITADRLLGRVTASMEVLGIGAALLGTLAGGLLGESLGLRSTLFLAAGGGLLAAGVLAGLLIRLPEGAHDSDGSSW